MEDGDIVDSDFGDVLSFDKAQLPGNDLGLVRSTGNEMEGVTSIHWAYVKEGKLPEFFSDELGRETSFRVPARFHLELQKYFAS